MNKKTPVKAGFLRGALIKSSRADTERFSVRQKDGKARNTGCISAFSSCMAGGKDSALSRRRFNQRFLRNRLKKYAPGHKNGFTLIEMLVVIAIIAILVAIIIPTATGAVQRAREARCLANMRALRAEYTSNALLNGVENPENGQKLIAQLAQSHGFTYKQNDGLQGSITGLCPSKGTCKCHFNFENYSFDLECSVHTGVSWDVKDLSDAIKGMSFTDIAGFPHESVEAYFKKGLIGIDSEGKASNYPGDYKSFADAIQRRLAAQGINVTDKTWRMDSYDKGSTINMYLADTKLDYSKYNKQVGTWVKCTKYNVTTGEVEEGYIKINSQNNSYLILDSKNFSSKIPAGGTEFKP